MADFNEIKNRLALLGHQTVAGIRGDLKSKDKIASGGLIGSLRSDVNELGGLIRMNIYASEHWEFVDKGRKPGKAPPPDAIQRWVSQKGIASGKAVKSVAYLIGQKIAREGIKPTNIFTDNFEKAQKEFIKSNHFFESIQNLARKALTPKK